jgi:hypothetical protein
MWGEEPPGVAPEPAHLIFDMDCTEFWVHAKNTAGKNRM